MSAQQYGLLEKPHQFASCPACNGEHLATTRHNMMAASALFIKCETCGYSDAIETWPRIDDAELFNTEAPQ